MSSIDLKFGIPAFEFVCHSGETINPAGFAGHELIVLFCPLDREAALAEIDAYLDHSREFVRHDGWLLAFTDERADDAGNGSPRALTIPDPELYAWTAFRNLTREAEDMDRRGGATFLFTRGGNLHRYWQGSGHVDDVIAELRKPSSENPHQVSR